MATKKPMEVGVLGFLQNRSGHYIVLTGVRDGGGFSAHDPGEEGPTEISREALVDQICVSGYLALRADDRAAIENSGQGTKRKSQAGNN